MNFPDRSSVLIADHRIARINKLAHRLRAEYSAADVSGPDAAQATLGTVRCVFRNGYAVTIGLDVDLPDGLFQVTRFLDPWDTPRFAFEGPSWGDAAQTDKLHTVAVLQILAEYQDLPPRPGEPGK